MSVKCVLMTSLASPTFKYPFENRYVTFAQCPRVGELIRVDYETYRVQDVLHDDYCGPLTLYVWQHGK